MQIQDITIMITHASSPLGSVTTNHLLNIGARLILVDSQLDRLKDVYESALLVSSKVEMLHLDLEDEHSIASAFHHELESLTSAYPIQCLINLWPCLNYPHIMHNDEFAEQSHLISKIISSTNYLTRLTAQQMYAKRIPGIIINVNDKSCQQSNLFNSTPILIQGFTKKWANELKDYDIRVAGLLPPDESFNSQGFQNKASEQGINIDEIVRNIEYIMRNKYCSGRVHEV